jgi:5'-nucleotidase
MLILLSNDDGYQSAGIAALEQAVRPLGTTRVVAPEQDRSAASNSLTLDRPLSLRTGLNGFQYLNGTPTDCVHVALTGLLPQQPALVVSGINDGANMGDDTLYSGTVAAATEAFLMGIPAIAFSLVKKGYAHLDCAARLAGEITARFAPRLLAEPMLLNVNLPACSYEQVAGWQITRLGKRHPAQPMVPVQSPKGETMYWIGPSGGARDAGPGTDFWAVEHNFVSITAIDLDLTHQANNQVVAQWLHP